MSERDLALLRNRSVCILEEIMKIKNQILFFGTTEYNFTEIAHLDDLDICFNDTNSILGQFFAPIKEQKYESLKALNIVIDNNNGTPGIIGKLKQVLPAAEMTAQIFNFILHGKILYKALSTLKNTKTYRIRNYSNVYSILKNVEITNYMAYLRLSIKELNTQINDYMQHISEYNAETVLPVITDDTVRTANSSPLFKILYSRTLAEEVILKIQQFLTNLLFQNFTEKVNVEIINILYNSSNFEIANSAITPWLRFYRSSKSRLKIIGNFIEYILINNHNDQIPKYKNSLNPLMKLVTPAVPNSGYLSKTIDSSSANDVTSTPMKRSSSTNYYLLSSPINTASIKSNANILLYSYMFFLLFLVLQNFEAGQYFSYSVFFQLQATSATLSQTIKSIITACIPLTITNTYKTDCIGALKTNMVVLKTYKVNYQIFPPREYFLRLFNGTINDKNVSISTDTINVTQIKNEQDQIYDNIVAKFDAVVKTAAAAAAVPAAVPAAPPAAAAVPAAPPGPPGPPPGPAPGPAPGTGGGGGKNKKRYRFHTSNVFVRDVGHTLKLKKNKKNNKSLKKKKSN
jgi:hypothetical protein